jgi:hypothetical protein
MKSINSAGESYPPYAAGPGHVISYDLAQYITSIPNPILLQNDDVNVDVWLYSVDVLRIHDERWHGGYALCCKKSREKKLDFLLLVNVAPEEQHVAYNYMKNTTVEDFPLKEMSYGDSKSCYIPAYPFRRKWVTILVVTAGNLFYFSFSDGCRFGKASTELVLKFFQPMEEKIVK